MNLKQMEAFRAIMETGSTTEAAGRLALSQPAVSRLLSQFEESVGFPLFLRRKGRLSATKEARELLKGIELLIENIQRVNRLTDELRLGRTSRTLLKVAVPSSMAHRRLPQIIANFLHERDDVVIELVSGSYEALERAVLEQAADFALVRLPTELKEFDTEPVLETEGVCVIPRGHALCARKVITLADLRETPLVLLGRQRPIRVEIEEHFRHLAIEPLIRVEVHSVAAACALAAEGVGVTIINKMVAHDYAHLNVEIRPFRPQLNYNFGIIWRKGIERTGPAIEFCELLKARLISEHQIV